MIQNFEFHETTISGLIEITPFYADDSRGDFIKDYSTEVFESSGINHDLREVFYSTSLSGVIRGMHFQRVKQQVKLVRCIHGHIYDVVVDLRKDSPTFKRWLAFDLTENNHKSILVPTGCAHGFLALEKSIVSYKCNEKFYGEYDDGIRWDDPDIGIHWPIEKVGGRDNLIISEKDQRLMSFAQYLSADFSL